MLVERCRALTEEVARKDDKVHAADATVALHSAVAFRAEAKELKKRQGKEAIEQAKVCT